MKITDIQVAEYRVPFAASDSRRTWTERRGLLLRLRDEDGRVGQGEASPLPGYSPDTLEECRRALEKNAAGGLPALDEDPSELIHLWGQRWIPHPPAAEFALQTAVLDLHGQRSGRSLAQVLTGKPPGEVALAALVTGGSADAMLASARAAVARGVRTLKVKLAKNLAGQLPALRAIRLEVGDDVEMRLDANGAWDVAQARANLAALAELRPEFVEDPVPPGLWPDLGPVPVVLAVDEALGTAHKKGALGAPGVRVAVLKPSRLGGFDAAWHLPWRAPQIFVDLDLVIGHMYEGPVAMAAAAELALALPRVRACGLDRHAALEAWGVTLPQIKADRIVSVGPGLGLPALDLPAPRRAG
jgi:o-succinylbenzoate synthase